MNLLLRIKRIFDFCVRIKRTINFIVRIKRIYYWFESYAWVYHWCAIPFKFIYKWCAKTAVRSWYAHGFATLGIALVVRFCINLFHDWPHALVLGAGMGFSYYLGRELGDWWKYYRSGRLREQDEEGVRRSTDGFGDLVGPLFVFLGILFQWRVF